MKKHLLAAAVVSAFAAPAMAQNVTVYGNFDATIATVKASGVSKTEQGSGDYLGSSVFGFQGSEDLGGGLKAFFKMEGDLNVGNGAGDGSYTQNATATTTTVSGANNYAGGFTFDRQMHVGISGSFGTIAIGRQSDFADSIQGASEVGANLFDFKEADLGGKNPNTTSYVSPKLMGGITVRASYSNDILASAEGRAQGADQGVVGFDGEISGLKYAFASVSRGATTGTTTMLNYNFGFADVYFNYNTKDAGAGAKSNDKNIGVKAPLGNGMTLLASVGRHGNDTATSKREASGVAISKALSKRTTVYVGYAKEDVNNGITGDVETSTIGLQHTF